MSLGVYRGHQNILFLNAVFPLPKKKFRKIPIPENSVQQCEVNCPFI